MFGAQGATHERTLVVDMDLGQVARIVENDDLFTDEGRKRWLDIASPHETDTVTSDFA
jgi:hypothetical protein